MDNSISNRQPGYAGVNITCNVIDPTKLPPDSPLLNPQPTCQCQPSHCDCKQPQSSYPVNYYINNYGYMAQDMKGIPTVSSGTSGSDSSTSQMPPMPPFPPFPPFPTFPPYPSYPNGQNGVNTGNTKQKRVQILTDNYIKNLEAYLNSPSEDMRKFAAQEVIKRLDEDKTRYDDAALNALINKMLLDPACHKVKATALMALETQLAQGNDNTVKILTEMARNDKSRDGSDAATAASILLKMSSPTKLVNVPKGSNKERMTE